MTGLEALTAELLGALWASIGNGTVLVVVTALVIWVFGRRLPAGAQAVLWTVALVKFLVDHGANLTMKDRNGRTPLDEAGAVEDGPGGGSNTHQVRPEAQALIRRLMGLGGTTAARNANQ